MGTKISPKKHIIIKGAKMHNLKNIDVHIPRNHLVVVTGVSGSGKSSLTIDTLYAEGQRRYVESLSSYARQFLERMNKPEVDYIKGICPAIAIEQKVITRSSRSTVGTLTEIYDYLRLLYARIGKTYSPVSGELVKKDSVSDVVDFVLDLADGTKLQVLIPFELKDSKSHLDQLQLLLQKGFSRVSINGELKRIEDITETDKQLQKKDIKILIDRLVVRKDDEDFENRTADSIQTAFNESEGDCLIEIIGKDTHPFNSRFEMDDMRFEEPNAHFFNFNSPYGACEKCEGFGQVIGIDPDLVMPNPNLSVYEGAIACWKGEKMSQWNKALIRSSHHFDFPVHKPIHELSKEEYELLWTGNRYFKGINDFFAHLQEKSYKIHYRILMSKYRGRTACRICKGSRLRKDVEYVKIGDKSINELVLIPIKKLRDFFQELELGEHDTQIAKRILLEINTRLNIMCEMGLGYLHLNRTSNTLSGGETQRINLTRTLGSNLTNSMYILDEPSIGLHPKDTQQMIAVLKKLRDLGNTVIVVEHEEEIMRSADYIIDMGPLAGIHGGEVVFAGEPKSLIKAKESLTADYLTGRKQVGLKSLRQANEKTAITIKDAFQHNLKRITVHFPLNAITVVSGVSGSGKTTLVKHILYPAIQRVIEKDGGAPGKYGMITGSANKIDIVEMVGQNPLGRSSRSNPVTYIKAYNSIRDLYAAQQASKIKGFKPKHFSFNVSGGRCETCSGDGFVTVEMQFLADVQLVCEECSGKRFKEEVIAVKYKDKSINDVLEMSVDEAIDFFAEDRPEIAIKIKPLQDVGLGYVKLGQNTGTLSGGEAQRVKLASYLGKGSSRNHVLFIFDEPSTGLHFKRHQ